MKSHLGWLIATGVIFLTGCSDPEGRLPTSTVFNWASPEANSRSWIEYNGSGWRNLRLLQLHARSNDAPPETPSFALEVYWVCGRDTLLVPSTIATSPAAGARPVTLGQKTNPVRYFEFAPDQLETFNAAMRGVCGRVPDASQPPRNILLSFDADSVTHLEASRFVRNGELIETWIRVDPILETSDEVSSSTTIDASRGAQLAQVAFDCGAARWATFRLDLFTPEGTPHATLPFSGEFITAVPGTNADANLNTACLIE